MACNIQENQAAWGNQFTWLNVQPRSAKEPSTAKICLWRSPYKQDQPRLSRLAKNKQLLHFTLAAASTTCWSLLQLEAGSLNMQGLLNKPGNDSTKKQPALLIVQTKRKILWFTHLMIVATPLLHNDYDMKGHVYPPQHQNLSFLPLK